MYVAAVDILLTKDSLNGRGDRFGKEVVRPEVGKVANMVWQNKQSLTHGTFRDFGSVVDDGEGERVEVKDCVLYYKGSFVSGNRDAIALVFRSRSKGWSQCCEKGKGHVRFQGFQCVMVHVDKLSSCDIISGCVLRW